MGIPLERIAMLTEGSTQFGQLEAAAIGVNESRDAGSFRSRFRSTLPVCGRSMRGIPWCHRALKKSRVSPHRAFR